MENKLWNALQTFKSEGYEWVELSHSLNNDSPFWSGIPEGSVELSKVVFDWGNPMLECLIHTFKFPGQFGTHVDFPGHFVKDAPLSEKYGVKDFVFPLAVIDISEKVKENVDYAVTVDDIKAYEAKYGPIPEGAFVALRTDWYKRWPDMEKLANAGADGNEHCPGWSLDALKYIFEVRKAAANGHETLDTDASYLAVEAGDLKAGFEAAHALKGALGNLSLKPVYDPVCEITELLRAGTETDYAPLLAAILAGRDRLKELAEA